MNPQPATPAPDDHTSMPRREAWLRYHRRKMELQNRSIIERWSAEELEARITELIEELEL